jgi:hypothetical protein
VVTCRKMRSTSSERNWWPAARAFGRSVDQAEVDHLDLGAPQAIGHSAEVPFQPCLQAFELRPVGVEANAEQSDPGVVHAPDLSQTGRGGQFQIAESKKEEGRMRNAALPYASDNSKAPDQLRRTLPGASIASSERFPGPVANRARNPAQ